MELISVSSLLVYESQSNGVNWMHQQIRVHWSGHACAVWGLACVSKWKQSHLMMYSAMKLTIQKVRRPLILWYSNQKHNLQWRPSSLDITWQHLKSAASCWCQCTCRINTMNTGHCNFLSSALRFSELRFLEGSQAPPVYLSGKSTM